MPDWRQVYFSGQEFEPCSNHSDNVIIPLRRILGFEQLGLNISKQYDLGGNIIIRPQYCTYTNYSQNQTLQLSV